MSFTDPLRTTASALLPARLAEAPARRAAQLVGEAYAFTVLSCGLLLLLRIADAGVLSIFLVAAPLADRLVLVLEANRRDVYERRLGSRRANQRTALGLLCLFLGIVGGYASVAVWLGDREAARTFHFALSLAEVGDQHVLQRRFGAPLSLLANNLRVAVFVVVLGFVYRAYGGMLAIAWNACVWASVLTVLVLRLDSSGPSRLLVAAALLPHLVLEAGAYVLLALAAIFASKGIAAYGPHDDRLRSVLRAACVLTALAFAMLLAAVMTEAWLVPSWLPTS